MGEIFALELKQNERLVLLAMANFARDDGTKIYPSVNRISWMTDYSKRQVQRIIQKLKMQKILIPVHAIKGGRGNAVEYRIDIRAGKIKLSPIKKGDAIVSPFKIENGDAIMSSFSTSKDDISDEKRATFQNEKDDVAVSLQTSLKTSLKTSTTNEFVVSSDLNFEISQEMRDQYFNDCLNSGTITNPRAFRNYVNGNSEALLREIRLFHQSKDQIYKPKVLKQKIFICSECGSNEIGVEVSAGGYCRHCPNVFSKFQFIENTQVLID